MRLIGPAKLLPEWSVRTTDHLPLICAGITDDTSICESVVRSLEGQGWNFGPTGHLGFDEVQSSATLSR